MSKVQIIASEEKQETIYSDRPLPFIVDVQLSDSHSPTVIENAVRRKLSTTLAHRKPGEWNLILGDNIEGISQDIESLHKKLNNWVSKFDSTENAGHTRDIARLVLCTVLWLASQDLSACVDIIQQWLPPIATENHQDDDVQPTNHQDSRITEKQEASELHNLIGQACGRALFNLYAYADPIPSFETHEILLSLIPKLCQYSWSSAETILNAAQQWSQNPKWAERFFIRPDGSAGELIDLVDILLPENKEALIHVLESWKQDMDGEPVSTSVKKLAEKLQLRIALGTRTSLPELPENHTYGLVIVDASSRDHHIRYRLAELASKVIERLTQSIDTLHLLTYRMGQDFPIAGPQETPEADVLIPHGLGRRPRLLGPLLEMHSLEQVGVVLLLANSPALDEEDWCETNWNEQIVVYSEDSTPSWAEKFILLPKQSNEDDAQEVITKCLSKKIGV